ncbi:MAG: chemotaxis protein CheW [Pseudomonadales bacterium]|nr:chemotaxis protein CheW [Pseudomonadales bacterium]
MSSYEQNGTNSREFLVFSLAQEEYAIDILKVQEIRGYENVTRIANAPDFLKGVINLREVIVPIIDLRLKLKVSASYDSHTVVIVININTRVIGIVVDGVSDVMALAAEQIFPVPEMNAGAALNYLTGVGKLDERMFQLVDIEKMLSSEELALLDKAA